MLLTQIHCHSTRSDGKSEPEEVIRNYINEAYQVLAISDHIFGKEEVWDNAQYQEKFPEIILLNASEVSTREHYIYIKENEEEVRIKAHPNRYNDSIAEIEDWGKKHGPYEVTEHAVLHKKYFATKRGYPVFSDDAHHKEAIGRCGLLVDAKKDKEDIVRNIREGNFRLWANDLQVWPWMWPWIWPWIKRDKPRKGKAL